jgi:predicted lipoprotein with Yx(FWY)xxD motif
MPNVLSREPDSTAPSPEGLSRRWAARTGLGTALVAVGLLAAACGSSAAKTAGSPTTSTGASTSSTASSASSGTVMLKTAKIADLGTVLVDGKGMTLYHYTLDHPPTIACTGACASIWPPLLVPSGAHVKGPAGLGTISRPGGAVQATYHGFPLYTYSGDKAAGQASGEGYTHNWYVLKVGGAPTASGSTTATSTGASSGGY